MDKKKIITIISIVVTIIIVAIVAVLLIRKNNLSKNTIATGNNMSDKEQFTVEQSPEQPSSEPTEEPTEEPSVDSSTEPAEGTPSPVTTKKPSTPVAKYYIKVNNQANTVTIYVKDKNGNYTVPVKAMVCSTGYASPKNSKYQLKGRWTWGEMIGGVYAQWETHITDNILFHSVPYLRRYDYNSLEYWAYDQLGTTCSAGCIRLTCADAKWIYDNCSTGTWVEFYSSSNPGPLGKPSAMKISGYKEYRGWDPTDPHKGNPWRNANLNLQSPKPSPTPIKTPDIIETPSVKPTPTQTPTPTLIPSIKPTQTPSVVPSVKPTKTPIVITTIKPTQSAKPASTPTTIIKVSPTAIPKVTSSSENT